MATKPSPFGGLEIESDRLAILFDRNSGRILHAHRTTNLTGAPKLGESELARRALDSARRTGAWKDDIDHDVIVIDPDLWNPDAVLTVNPKTRKIVSSARRRDP